MAAGARACVGTRFRAQGRDAAGMDCVGVVVAALAAGGVELRAPCDYALRGGEIGRVGTVLDAAGLRPVDAPWRAGDVLVINAGAAQLHLAVATDAAFVHADAGLRRVVERPGAPPWPVIAIWRREEG